MAKRSRQPEHDAGPHVSQLRDLLAKTVRQVRHDLSNLNDLKSRALFETTAEVLDGLIRACDHAEQQTEPAWM